MAGPRLVFLSGPPERPGFSGPGRPFMVRFSLADDEGSSSLPSHTKDLGSSRSAFRSGFGKYSSARYW